jgi:hypothetical protein
MRFDGFKIPPKPFCDAMDVTAHKSDYNATTFNGRKYAPFG